MDQRREILRLKKEIQELRQKNNSTQNSIYHQNLHSYINTNTIKNSIEENDVKKFSQKGKFLNNPYKNNYKHFYPKPPFKQGIFSYKTSLNNNNNNNNLNINNNIGNNKKTKNSNNSSLILSSNIQLNFDNDEINSNSNNISINKSISSIDLNKYKINTNNNQRNSNILNHNISDTTSNSYNNKNLKVNNNIQSIERLKISPIPSKSKNCISPYLIVIDNDMTSQSFINNNKLSLSKRTFIEDESFFKLKNKYEKESRRMSIEYIKILMKSQKTSLENILSENHFSHKILQQTKLGNNNNICNINNNNHLNLNTSYKLNKNQNIFDNQINSTPPLLSNSVNYNKLSNLKAVSKFVKNMKENEKKDKIEMINYLCIPRYMKMLINNNNHAFLFILCPNKLSYLNGIESYIFKWMDLSSQKYIGGFDLIKVNFCSINNNEPNRFLIETFDGITIRNYDIDSGSMEICSNYVKFINYLSQLEKCKLFNHNNILK